MRQVAVDTLITSGGASPIFVVSVLFLFDSVVPAAGGSCCIWLATADHAGGWIPKAALTMENDDGGLLHVDRKSTLETHIRMD